jgi:8-oxo-dGTP pyrophosphatase MutT (NUDIX family)
VIDAGSALDRLLAALDSVDASQHDLTAMRQTWPEARVAAVLALFYPLRDAPHLILTRRSPDLKHHSGQISFPGGRIESSDPSPAEAALRETREELGIATTDVRLHGTLDPVFTVVSNFVLLPIVGSLPARPSFVPDPREVAELIDLPLATLLGPSAAEEEWWELRGRVRKVSFYRYGKHKIWGATAKVLRQIVELAGGPRLPGELLPPGDVDPETHPPDQPGP